MKEKEFLETLMNDSLTKCVCFINHSLNFLIFTESKIGKKSNENKSFKIKHHNYDNCIRENYSKGEFLFV